MITARILAIALAVMTLLTGWNWYWKVHYKTAMTIAASNGVANARKIEREQSNAIDAIASNYATKEKLANEDFAKQLTAIAEKPAVERTVYRLRDRFTCPATDRLIADSEGERGLQIADEQFLVSESERADRIVRKYNALIDACEVGR